MLEVGTLMFLLIPDQAKRAHLHPGKILSVASGRYDASFVDAISAAQGSAISIFQDDDGKFLQQPARVLELRQVESIYRLSFAFTGDPSSAEQRKTFRVSTLTAGIDAQIARMEHCPVLDVSAEGFGAILPVEWAVGSMLQAVFAYREYTFSAIVRLQNIRPRPDGTFRGGFFVPENCTDARKALQHMSGAIQRMHLRRLAGAG